MVFGFYRSKISKVETSPLVIRLHDETLGIIGTYELPLHSITFVPRRDQAKAVLSCTLHPTSELIKAGIAKGDVKIPHANAPIQLTFCPRLTRTRHQFKPDKYPLYPSSVLLPKLNKTRTRRWTIRQCHVDEMDFLETVQLWTKVQTAQKVRLNAGTGLADGFVPVTSGLYGFVQRLSLRAEKSQRETGNVDLVVTVDLKSKVAQPYTIKMKNSADSDLENGFLTRHKSLLRLLTTADDERTNSFFRSLSDILTFGERSPAEEEMCSVIHHTKSESFEPRRSPVILDVDPKRIPASGNVAITITGYNLGRNRTDIVHVFICGQDCADSVEYTSSRKVVCRSKAFVPCTGIVSLFTKRGGKSLTCQLVELYDPLYRPREEGSRDDIEYLTRLQQMNDYEQGLTAENAKCIRLINGKLHCFYI